MFQFRTIVLCSALILSTGLAAAQGTSIGFGTIQADPEAPVEVTADTLDVDQNSGRAVFEGNVVVGQGQMRLSAPRLLVIYNPEGGIDRLEATGGVTLVSGEDAAEADRADYTIASGVVVLMGDVLLTQGDNALTAEEMTVNLTTGTARMTGRVKTILNPAGDQ